MRWCLSFHASYGCRHSGACCNAGWEIPFDQEEAARVEALPLPIVGSLSRTQGSTNRAFAAKRNDGTCAFFELQDHLCAIHRIGGEAALPTACRMFPRLVLRDARGAFVSLSHFCPTAAALLFDAPAPDRVVEAPVSLVDDERLDGLDATDAWPPLLRPGVLMDIDSYADWERRGIGVLTSGHATPWEALNRLAQATAIVVRWIPDSAERSLREWTEAAFEGSSDPATAAEPDGSLFSIVRQAVPSSLTRPTAPVDLPRRLDATSDAMRRHSRAVNRWLAGRLFGTWIAYQGGGLLTIVRYLRAALDVLTVELARAAAKGISTGPPCWKACVGATISSSTWPSRSASPVFCPETLCLFSIGFFATSPRHPRR